MNRARVRYTGRVQGVGFRATARSLAAGYQITGWVRNEPDGGVLLEAQGERGEVDRFLAALGQRMRGSIRGEDGSSIGARDDERGFVIDR